MSKDEEKLEYSNYPKRFDLPDAQSLVNEHFVVALNFRRRFFSAIFFVKLN